MTRCSGVGVVECSGESDTVQCRGSDGENTADWQSVTDRVGAGKLQTVGAGKLPLCAAIFHQDVAVHRPYNHDVTEQPRPH